MTEYYAANDRSSQGVSGFQTELLACTVNNGSTTITKVGGFVVAGVGQPVYLYSATTATVGIYIIIVIISNDEITVDRVANDGANDSTVTLWKTPCNGTAEKGSQSGANGPFPTLQYATDAAPTGSSHRINILAGSGWKFDNLDQPKTGGASICWEIDAFEGVRATGVFNKIEGYTADIGDGGVAVLDGDGQSVDVVNIEADNLIIKNIRTTNVSGDTNNAFVATSGKGVFFIGCTGDNAGRGFMQAATTGEHTVCIDCIAYNNGKQGFLGANGVSGCSMNFINCTAYDNTLDGFMLNGPAGTDYNCISYGNGRDNIRGQVGSLLSINGTAYDATDDGITAPNPIGQHVVFNTIVKDSGDKNFEKVGTIYYDYCDSYGGGAGDVGEQGDNNLTVDPYFVNPGSPISNFDVRNMSVIQGGIANHHMGALIRLWKPPAVGSDV